MDKFLEKLIESKTKKADELRSQIKASESADEVRSLGEELDEVNAEIKEAEDKLEEIKADEKEKEEDDKDVPEEAELRGGNPIAHFSNVEKKEVREMNILETMEYRNAFAQYVRTGVWDAEVRDDETLTTGDIGKVIPTTIMNEVVKKLTSYGELYKRVRKMNVKGGVEFPIEDLIPEVKWVTEVAPSSTQSAPELKTSVSFGYHMAEAKIAQSLLSSIVALEMLESEIAKLIAEAFVKAFDEAILNGSGSGAPTGILKDARVPASNKITMTATKAVDWTKWRSDVFAKIPLAYRAGGIFAMTVDTWESVIMSLKDSNNRPLATETFDVATGNTICRFNGKEVVLVESDLGLADYSTATSGDAYMVYFKPESYAINSNLQIGIKRYTDEDTNKVITKGLCVVDGKLLDANGAFIISK